MTPNNPVAKYVVTRSALFQGALGCRGGDGAGFGWQRRFWPYSQRPAIRLVDVEGAGLADQVAELAIAVGARVEVGGHVGQPLADDAQAHPAVLRLHLRDGFGQDRNRRAGRLARLEGGAFFGSRHLGLGQQVLDVNEAPARLSEALRGLLGAEAIDIGSLLAKTGGQAGEVAVRGNQT